MLKQSQNGSIEILLNANSKNKCNFFEVSSKRGLIDNLLILFDQKQRQSMNYKQLTLEKRYQISALSRIESKRDSIRNWCTSIYNQ